MEYKLVINATLPGLNQYQYACRTHFIKGATMKKQWVMVVSAYIAQQLRGIHITKKVFMNFIWYEPNRKRDLDNISGFGRKVIQDALVDNQVLFNDGWKNISGFSDKFYVDKKNPRIEVYIEEED